MHKLLVGFLIAVSTVATAQDFEVDHDGRWIVRGLVTQGEIQRQVCLIVDTGSEISLLDVSMKALLELRSTGRAKVEDLGRTKNHLDVVEVEGFRTGPHHFTKVQFLLSDLHQRFSGSMDNPVDGILGMNLLRSMVICWNHQSQVLQWGIGEQGQYDEKVRIEFTGNLPYLPIELAGKTTKALFDTGAVGAGFILPSPASDDSRSTVGNSALGLINFSEGTFEGRILIGKMFWLNPLVNYVKQNAGKVILGNRLFRQNSIAMDFKAGILHIQTGSVKGEMRVPNPRRLKLALRWGEGKRLTIVGMKPGGEFEKAGFRPGDALIRLGELSGETLTIRTAYEYLETQKEVLATIQREGKELELAVRLDSPSGVPLPSPNSQGPPAPASPTDRNPPHPHVTPTNPSPMA